MDEIKLRRLNKPELYYTRKHHTFQSSTNLFPINDEKKKNKLKMTQLMRVETENRVDNLYVIDSDGQDNAS